MIKLEWDPEIDTPATVAIIGAGPVGVETALYARFLGYYVLLLDARRVGSRLIRWGDQPLSEPFGEVASSLGLAALEAHQQLAPLPTADESISCRDYVERYLTPVAKTDLIHESVQINGPVISVSRAHWPKGQPASVEERAEDEFRLLIDSRVRGEFTQLADITVDCTGDCREPQGIGPGGGLAIGQRLHRPHLQVGVYDVLDKDRDKFIGKRTTMFGCGPVACHNALQFAKLARENPATKLTWIVPKGIKSEQWLQTVAGSLPDLAIASSQLLTGDVPGVIHLAAWGAESIERNDSGIWKLRMLVGDEETVDISCDAVLLTETQSSWAMTDGLSIARCPKRGIAIAASQWLDENISDDLVISPESFITTEPHYYVLGRKSVGGDPRFTFRHARQQIQQLFGLIGGRRELDLYQTVRPQTQL